jgi:hypothetical protein
VTKKPAKKSHAKSSPELSTAPADDTVRREWLRRVEAEYRSGAHAQHLTLWLMQLGAPPDLIELGLRVVSDELKHAELSDEVYREAGGKDSPKLARETLLLRRRESEPLELDVLRTGLEMFCLGETVAVRLFTRLREGTSVKVARRALDRILRDEVGHRDFGWTLLEWLLETPMAEQFRARIAEDLPAMLTRVRRNYGGIALDRLGAEELERLGQELPASTRAWGVMPVSEYLEAVEETFRRDYAPRFAALDIAWPEKA